MAAPKVGQTVRFMGAEAEGSGQVWSMADGYMTVWAVTAEQKAVKVCCLTGARHYARCKSNPDAHLL